jgi:hypothetical protein
MNGRLLVGCYCRAAAANIASLTPQTGCSLITIDQAPRPPIDGGAMKTEMSGDCMTGHAAQPLGRQGIFSLE